MTVAIAVPRHGIAAVAVQVETDRIEPTPMTLGEQITHLLQHRCGVMISCIGRVPTRGQPRFVDDRVVHHQVRSLPQVESIQEFVEQRVGAGEPPGNELDPRSIVEVNEASPGEPRIDLRCTRPEQGRLKEHVFDSRAATPSTQVVTH